jgi:uncharacterized protein (TIGR02145 family)
MKHLISLLLFINFSNTVTCLAQQGTLTDYRDGKVYKTIQIANQIWMAENLAYVSTFSYSFISTNKLVQSGIYCFDDNKANCQKYGMLYTLDAALNACPVGWHLPTKAEYETLFFQAGWDGYLVYQALIEGGGLKFEATLGGYYSPLSRKHNKLFDKRPFSEGSWGKGGGYWTSSRDEEKTNSGNYVDFNSHVKRTVIADRTNKLFGFSVRCIKDIQY